MKTKMKLGIRNLLLHPALPAMTLTCMVMLISIVALPQQASATASAVEWAQSGLGLILTVIQVFCIIAGVVLAMVGVYYMATGKAMEEGPKMNKGIAMMAGAVALFIVPTVIKGISWSRYLNGLTDPVTLN